MLAGSSEGQLFFRDRHQGFADAIYSAARLCHLLPALSQADARIPRYPSFTKQAQSTAAVDFTSLSAPYVGPMRGWRALPCRWLDLGPADDLICPQAECGGSIDGLMALKRRAIELQLSQLSQLELRAPDQRGAGEFCRSDPSTGPGSDLNHPDLHRSHDLGQYNDLALGAMQISGTLIWSVFPLQRGVHWSADNCWRLLVKRSTRGSNRWAPPA